ALCISAGAPGELWTGPSFFDRKWADEDPTPRFNGVDFDPAYLCEHGVENRVVAGKPGEPAMEEVLPGLFVLNGFARVHPSERPNPRFLVDRPASREEDDFRDEVCLVAETARGLVVVLGCAHPGIMNMLETVASVFGKAPYAVFGGSHLLEADEERLELTTRFLEKLDAASGGAFIAGLGHCTGKRAGAYLSERVRGYVPLQTGAHFTL
ncbi:MAG TPA: MBL fold metallo-hydrolase, partial [Spirochaetia bacterium]|nr:MBL fold metallo-hydrolase [Spirochaetia bacterium]